jgi:hypothetical protein
MVEIFYVKSVIIHVRIEQRTGSSRLFRSLIPFVLSRDIRLNEVLRERTASDETIKHISQQLVTCDGKR